MFNKRVLGMIILIIPIMVIVGCKKTTTNSAQIEGNNMAYDYKIIADNNTALSKTLDVYSYDIGGVSVLSTYDVRGGINMQAELVPAQSGNSCDGDNNVFIVKKGDDYILFDSGYGDKNPSSSMKKNYEAIGVDMDNLKTIIMTHLHPDHSAGLTNGYPSLLDPTNKPTKKYPNAKIYVPKKELDFWTQTKLQPGVASDLYYTKLDWAGNNTFFEFGSSIVKDMVDAYGDNVIPIDENFAGEIAMQPYISKMNLFGHTPGHTAYIIKGDTGSVIIAGDFINCARAQFDNTSISAIYDFNFADAKKSRETLMKYATEKGLIIGSTHAPVPGFMTINKK